MNNYDITLASMQELLELDVPKVDKKAIKLQIASLQIVKDKSDREINALYDTGVFNDITYGYLSAVMQYCNISEDKKAEMLESLHWLHDTMCAGEIVKKMQKDSIEEHNLDDFEDDWEK